MNRARTPLGVIRLSVFIPVVLAILAAPYSAAAQDLLEEETTKDMEVRFEVEAACTLSTETLDFGSDFAQDAEVEAEGTITVTCPDDLAYEIGISPGHGTNDFSSGLRGVITPDEAVLRYGLYRDSARTIIWGDGDNIGSRKAAAGTGTAQSHTVYGELLLTPTAPTGTYRDIVRVSIFL